MTPSRRSIKVLRRASREISEASAWWAINRPAAPKAFDEDLRRAFKSLSKQPLIGKIVEEVKFAVRHASSTVRRYMVKRHPPSDSKTWRSSLKNQAKVIEIEIRRGFSRITTAVLVDQPFLRPAKEPPPP